ncbi:MAG TPA: hypothetical protein VMT43_07465 [Acidimicrobiales bacterium]|nr:hypothetical protein [Acidimicrobiales bacterium]
MATSEPDDVVDEYTRTPRHRVVCYRRGSSVEALTTEWHDFDDALAETKRRTSPQPSMRATNYRRVPEADGTMIFCIDPDYPDSEPYRHDAEPHWIDAAAAAGGSFPWGDDLPMREIDKLMRAGAARWAS